MLSRDAANTNFIVIGLTREGLDPTIYCRVVARTIAVYRIFGVVP
jgi:hypothetical protein